MITKFVSTLFLIFWVISTTQAQDALAANKPEGLPKTVSTVVASNSSGSKGVEIDQFVFSKYASKEIEENNENIEAVLAEKFQILHQTFTYTTPVAPGNPGLKTVVRKPVIYNAMTKLEKHYRKLLKDGSISEREAQIALSKAIDVALAAFYGDTEKFESTLKSTKDIRVVAQIFEQTVIR